MSQDLIVKKIKRDLKKRTMRQIASSLRLKSHATIYNWVNGKPISDENLIKLQRYYK